MRTEVRIHLTRIERNRVVSGWSFLGRETADKKEGWPIAISPDVLRLVLDTAQMQDLRMPTYLDLEGHVAIGQRAMALS